MPHSGQRSKLLAFFHLVHASFGNMSYYMFLVHIRASHTLFPACLKHVFGHTTGGKWHSSHVTLAYSQRNAPLHVSKWP